jgi:hypothetical protein
MRAPRTLTALVAGGLLALAVTAPVSAAAAPVLSATPTTDPIVLSSLESVAVVVTNADKSKSSTALTVSLSGAAGFAITNDTCSGIALGPRKSCAVEVTHVAATPTTDQLATLTVASKKPAVASVSRNFKVVGVPTAQSTCEDHGGTYSNPGSVFGTPQCDLTVGTGDSHAVLVYWFLHVCGGSPVPFSQETDPGWIACDPQET